MQIKNSIALVSGANRGLGLAFVQALLASGAHKVYAACGDVTLLINDAGISDAQGQPLLHTGSAQAAQREFETNVLGRCTSVSPSRQSWPGMEVAPSSTCCPC